MNNTEVTEEGYYWLKESGNPDAEWEVVQVLLRGNPEKGQELLRVYRGESSRELSESRGEFTRIEPPTK